LGRTNEQKITSRHVIYCSYSCDISSIAISDQSDTFSAVAKVDKKNIDVVVNLVAQLLKLVHIDLV